MKLNRSLCGVLPDIYHLLIHDAFFILCIFLFFPQAAKMANYAKCQTLCNLLFAVFSILFISSRLGVLPVW